MLKISFLPSIGRLASNLYLSNMKKTFLCVMLMLFIGGTTTLNAQSEIQWLEIAEIETAVANDPKPVFIDLWTSWCGWCKRMDATTFKDEKIIAYINANFHPVKFDGEHKSDVLFKGKTYKFVNKGRRGYHELAAAILQGKMSYPTFVVLNEEFQIMQSLPGYRTADEFLPILTFIGDRHYENTSWEDFKSAWDGKSKR